MSKRIISHQKRAIIVGAGPLKPAWLKRELSALRLASTDLVIGVDGGVRSCMKAGFRPHFAIGDWDSLSSRGLLQGIPFVTLKRKKDQSDLFFAVEAARFVQAKDLLVFGALGGRFDQTLACVFDLAQAAMIRKSPFSSIRALSPSEQLHFISSRNSHGTLELKKGQTFSLFSLLQDAKGVSLKGTEFSGSLPRFRQSSLGLSNRALASRIQIGVEAGVVVVVVPR